MTIVNGITSRKGRLIKCLVFERNFDHDHCKDHDWKWDQDIVLSRKHISYAGAPANLLHLLQQHEQSFWQGIWQRIVKFLLCNFSKLNVFHRNSSFLIFKNNIVYVHDEKNICLTNILLIGCNINGIPNNINTATEELRHEKLQTSVKVM